MIQQFFKKHFKKIVALSFFALSFSVFAGDNKFDPTVISEDLFTEVLNNVYSFISSLPVISNPSSVKVIQLLMVAFIAMELHAINLMFQRGESAWFKKAGLLMAYLLLVASFYGGFDHRKILPDEFISQIKRSEGSATFRRTLDIDLFNLLRTYATDMAKDFKTENTVTLSDFIIRMRYDGYVNEICGGEVNDEAKKTCKDGYDSKYIGSIGYPTEESMVSVKKDFEDKVNCGVTDVGCITLKAFGITSQNVVASIFFFIMQGVLYLMNILCIVIVNLISISWIIEAVISIIIFRIFLTAFLYEPLRSHMWSALKTYLGYALIPLATQLVLFLSDLVVYGLLTYAVNNMLKVGAVIATSMAIGPLAGVGLITIIGGILLAILAFKITLLLQVTKLAHRMITLQFGEIMNLGKEFMQTAGQIGAISAGIMTGGVAVGSLMKTGASGVGAGAKTGFNMIRDRFNSGGGNGGGPNGSGSGSGSNSGTGSADSTASSPSSSSTVDALSSQSRMRSPQVNIQAQNASMAQSQGQQAMSTSPINLPPGARGVTPNTANMTGVRSDFASDIGKQAIQTGFDSGLRKGLNNLTDSKDSQGNISESNQTAGQKQAQQGEQGFANPTGMQISPESAQVIANAIKSALAELGLGAGAIAGAKALKDGSESLSGSAKKKTSTPREKTDYEKLKSEEKKLESKRQKLIDRGDLAGASELQGQIAQNKAQQRAELSKTGFELNSNGDVVKKKGFVEKALWGGELSLADQVIKMHETGKKISDPISAMGDKGEHAKIEELGKNLSQSMNDYVKKNLENNGYVASKNLSKGSEKKLFDFLKSNSDVKNKKMLKDVDSDNNGIIDEKEVQQFFNNHQERMKDFLNSKNEQPEITVTKKIKMKI